MQEGSVFRGTFDFEEPAFDWGADYQRPGLAPQELIVYEMGVRSFTADESSTVGAERQGTFLGLLDKAGPPAMLLCQPVSAAWGLRSVLPEPARAQQAEALTGLQPAPIAARCHAGAADVLGPPVRRRAADVAVAPQIPHLVELGINCVELLPVLEYDELEFQRSPNPRDHMVNIWGYSHISFMAPMSRFATGGAGDRAAALLRSMPE